MTVVLARPNSRKDHIRRPCTKKVAPAKQQLKNSDKTTLHTAIEAKVMPAPASTRPDEREFVVDLGASMHMTSKKELSSGEMDTVMRSRTLTVVLTANGEVRTHEEAQVFVHDQNLFVAVQLLEETPAVLSLCNLREDHGYSYECVSGQKPRLTKEGKNIISYLLSLHGYPPILKAVRLLHRYHRTR